MASPTMETFCCVMENVTHHPSSALDFRSHQTSYNVTSVSVAVLAMVGGIYQLLPRHQNSSEMQSSFYSRRQRKIIDWLALADCLAALGLLIRSLAWLFFKHDGTMCSSKHVLCAVMSGWTQFFYTATYFWNLSYAIDIYRMLHQKNSVSMGCYHLMVWSLSTIDCAIGLGTLYYPNLNCRHDLAHVLPNYLCSILPLLLIMVTNPFLYFLSSKQVKELLFSTGMITQHERKTISTFVQRFFRFVLIFYLCWVPNLLNSIVLWSMWPSLQSVEIPLLTLWYLMAILNPLQAVFNAIVYRTKRGRLKGFDWLFTSTLKKPRTVYNCHENSLHDHSTPLLGGMTTLSTYKTSINDALNSSL